jgi:hypothetical protein
MARRSSDAVRVKPDSAALVAERAYFKAEQRGFAPGREIEDWLEAERELHGAVKPKKAPPRRKAAASKK